MDGVTEGAKGAAEDRMTKDEGVKWRLGTKECLAEDFKGSAKV